MKLGRQGPVNIELFGGSADDNNALFYDGAMVLDPTSRAQTAVQSKQTGMNRCQLALGRRCGAGPHGQPAGAYYGKARVDAVLSPMMV